MAAALENEQDGNGSIQEDARPACKKLVAFQLHEIDGKLQLKANADQQCVHAAAPEKHFFSEGGFHDIKDNVEKNEVDLYRNLFN